MRIIMAGTSGFLGRHLIPRLTGEGHEVVRLVRRPARGISEVQWDPEAGSLDPQVLDGAAAVVNLCGVGVGAKRWTPEYKRRIRTSRVDATRLLAEAVARTGVPTLVNASAVGWYGDNGEHPVDESADYAADFLGVTCKAWEDATEPAAAAGARVVTMRTGHVLAADSALLQRFLPVWRFGLGGRFGSGRQYFPWVSLADWLAAAQFLVESDVSGPVNLVGPVSATNAEFAKALGRALHRPAPFVVPGSALKLIAGEAAVELLRGSKVLPQVLWDNNFRFRHEQVGDAVEWAVNSR